LDDATGRSLQRFLLAALVDVSFRFRLRFVERRSDHRIRVLCFRLGVDHVRQVPAGAERTMTDASASAGRFAIADPLRHVRRALELLGRAGHVDLDIGALELALRRRGVALDLVEQRVGRRLLHEHAEAISVTE